MIRNTVANPNIVIGRFCAIARGVRIGNGAIVSTRSVVASDVPACTILGADVAALEAVAPR